LFFPDFCYELPIVIRIIVRRHMKLSLLRACDPIHQRLYNLPLLAEPNAFFVAGMGYNRKIARWT
jgi:hypothetical protein